MKILYIAKHNNGFNDDEGAIAYALEKLGHEVIKFPENQLIKFPENQYKVLENIKVDLCLFHKFNRFELLNTLKIPKVFWYFDLIDFNDPTVHRISRGRKRWMKEAINVSNLGFCTDGDYVASDKSGKLIWLNQGADERIAKKYDSTIDDDPPIMFSGTGIASTKKRKGFINRMTKKYGEEFRMIRSSYREELGKCIANSKIAVAPDSPLSDRYWSNRVYMSLGFGAFMMHPYAKGLTEHYKHGKEIVFYHSREELEDLIEMYLSTEEGRRERKKIAIAGLARTLKDHTYTRRCEQLITTVRERLL